MSVPMMVTLLMLLALTQQAPPRDAKPVAAARLSVIAGRVVDAQTEAPISAAIVSVSRVGVGARPVQLEADERGMFRFIDLPPGNYRIVVSAPEHRPTHLSKVWNVDPQLSNTLRPSLQLKIGEVRDDIVVRLDRALAMEGVVVDESGGPIAEARVTVERLEGVGFGAGMASATDDRGFFRAFLLAPGAYRVCASPGNSLVDFHLGRGVQWKVTEQPYVRTCSARVVVHSGNVPHVHLVMSRVIGYSVSGRIASESGRERLHVSLSRLDEEDSRNFEAELRDGAFIARGVPPGDYAVRATATPVAPGPSEPEMTMTEVRVDADVSGIELVTTKGATVTGRIVPEGPLPPGTRLTVNRGSTYRRLPTMAPLQAVVRDDYNFELRSMHDPMVFMIGGLPRGWVVTAVLYRGVDIIDRLTTFTTTREPSELEIVVSPHSSQLGVRPVDAEGRLVEGARVHLIGATGDRAAIVAVEGINPESEHEGAIQMPPVRPGKYILTALRPGEALPRGADQAAQLRRLGTPVVLEAGGRQTIDVVVATIPEQR